MLRLAAVLVAVLCCTTSAAYANAKTTHETVSAILPDGSLQLARGGKAVFANILAPEPDLLAAWLAEHVLQQEIPYVAGEDDRYGRVQIVSDAQEKLLRDGAAMVYATQGDVPANWRSAEAAARSAKRGIWANPLLVLTPDNAGQHIGRVAIIEGTVTRIYDAKNATYINFGADWHSDFSITITAKQRRSMKALLAALKPGDRLRVRGGIVEENGPMVRLNHPANLERL